MRAKELLKDRYLQALSVLCVVYIIYWTLYGNYQYSTFNDQYYDMGAFMSTMYQHLSCLSNVVGLQYLVFANHISPFMLLVLPFFALYQSPITLFAIQDIFLALSAIAIYAVCKNLLGSRKIGFVLAFVFLISAAVRGFTLYDFHEEAFVPFFYILSFYFFWKADKKYFIAAYSLMMSLFEPSVAVGIALLAGLLFYELLYKAKSQAGIALHRKRMRLLAIGVAITILFSLFYFVVSTYLINGYSSAPYSSVSPISMVLPYISSQVNALTNPGTVASLSERQLYVNLYGPIGVAILFLGFGVTSFISPILSTILLSPWLGEVFIINNAQFALPQSQYLGFFAGASVVASIIGLIIIKEKETFLARWINFDSKRFELAFICYTLISTLIISYLILIGTNSLHSLLLDNATSLNYTQIYGTLASIPQNASVLAQTSIATHLYMHCDIELAPIGASQLLFSPDIPTVFWFKPDYIIVDKDLPEYDIMLYDPDFNVFSYAKGNYTLQYNQSGIYIFKEINKSG